MSDPLVSIVITTFNTGQYLPETLDSVLAQSHRNMEVIVVDDGSTDDTVMVARSYEPHVTVMERPHEGLGPARAAGLACTTGDYVIFVDSDDLLEPEALHTQVSVAGRHRDCGLVVGDGVQFRGDAVTGPRLLGGKVAAVLESAPDGEVSGRMYREMLFDNPVCCPAQAIVPRWAADAVGAVTAADHGAQDYDYYLRIARRFPVTFHATPVARWRLRSDSMSGSDELRGLRFVGQALAVLEELRSSCAPEDQAVLERAITHKTRQGCVEAIHARLVYGAAPAPGLLASFGRLRPRDPIVASTRAAFALPAPADRWLLATIRGAGRLVRRCGRFLRFRPPTIGSRPG